MDFDEAFYLSPVEAKVKKRPGFSTSVRFREPDSQRQQVKWWCQTLAGGVGSQCFVGPEFQSGVMEKIWDWMVVVVTQHREYAQC